MAFTTLTSTIAHPITTSPAITSTSTLASTLPPYSLSNPPKWLLGVALSWLAFGGVLAIMLVVAQFPAIFPRWARVAGQQPRGRDKTWKPGVSARERCVSSAVARPDVEAEDGGFRLRKPRGLSVHTRNIGGASGQGLGILMSSGGDDKRAQQGKGRKQGSSDMSTTRTSSLCQPWQAATAPLPQTKNFAHTLDPASNDDSDDDEMLRCSDIETGYAMPYSRDLNDHYGERRASPYFNINPDGVVDDEDDVETKRNGLLGKLNQGVYKVADKLSATFYEQVNGAEEGLLLPVKETEREGWMGRVVG